MQEAWMALFILVMFIGKFTVIKLLVLTLVSYKDLSFKTVEIILYCNFHVELTANFWDILIWI